MQEWNPKKQHTAAWRRYEKYKVATTVGGALNLGARSVDIKYDLDHRFATKHFATPPPQSEPLQAHVNEVAEASLHTASYKHPPPPADHPLPARSTNRARAATASLRAAPVKRCSHSRGVDEELVLVPAGDPSAMCIPGSSRETHGSLASEREVQQQAELTQDLQTQLQTERIAVLRLEGELEVWKAEATSKEREIAELNQSVDAMKCEIAKLKQSARLPAERHQHITSRSQVVELALCACAHVESRSRSKGALLARQCEDARAWVAWMGEHLPCAMLQQHCPRVLAALVLHAAWCMEWGDGFPFTKCILRLVECTRHGRGHDLAFPQRAPLLAMQFLKLSAADCGKAAEAHSQLLMSIGKSSARGMPGRASED